MPSRAIRQVCGLAALLASLPVVAGTHIQYTINKEREADEALRTSEEKYRSILESVEEGYFETDLLGGIKFFNGPLCRILGYDAGELRAMTTQDFTTPETAAAAEAILDQVQRTGEATPVSNYVVRHKDGTHRDLELSLSLMPDAVGRPAGFRWVVRDVTERRKQRKELDRLHSRLRSIIDSMRHVVISFSYDEEADRIHTKGSLIGRNSCGPMVQAACPCRDAPARRGFDPAETDWPILPQTAVRAPG